MARPPTPLPDQAAEFRLHQRLLERDPTAAAELAAVYLDWLTDWLIAHNRRIDPALCEEAAGEALVALIRAPPSYKPDKRRLYVYLRMSAKRDLINAINKEEKHRQGRKSLASVELSPKAGKYLGRDDDPSLRLRVAEEAAIQRAEVPPSVWKGLTEPETRFLEAMLQGVKRTRELAPICGASHLPPREQRKEVHRWKDRLNRRIERAKEDDERST
jgi:Sigma-70 region 2